MDTDRISRIPGESRTWSLKNEDAANLEMLIVIIMFKHVYLNHAQMYIYCVKHTIIF